MADTVALTPNLAASPWKDLDLNEVAGATLERVGLLPDSTVDGRACVALMLRTNDGQVVVAQMTAAMFATVSAGVLTPTADPCSATIDSGRGAMRCDNTEPHLGGGHGCTFTSSAQPQDAARDTEAVQP